MERSKHGKPLYNAKKKGRNRVEKFIGKSGWFGKK